MMPRYSDPMNMRSVPVTTQEVPSLSLALAEALAGRLCHDLAGMVGTLMGAVELANEDLAMSDEALPMAAEAATMLGHRLRLMRAAWGSEGCTMDGQDLRALAAGLPPARRVRVALDGIRPERKFSAGSARILLNLLILAAESVSGEGIVTLDETTGNNFVLSISGPRAAWPAGFAGQLADPQLAWKAATTCGPRLLQAPLSALIAHQSGVRVSVLLGSDDQATAPLVIDVGEAPQA